MNSLHLFTNEKVFTASSFNHHLRYAVININSQQHSHNKPMKTQSYIFITFGLTLRYKPSITTDLWMNKQL